MLEKFSTLLHSVNENPKTRFVLDLVCISILTLALVFCIFGVQSCLDTRTVYAAEEDSPYFNFDGINLGDAHAVLELGSGNASFGYSNPILVVYTAKNADFNADNCLMVKENGDIYFNFKDASSFYLYQYKSSSYSLVTSYNESSIPAGWDISLKLVNVLYSSVNIYHCDSNHIPQDLYYEKNPTPLPPFSLETFATDYIPLVTSSIIDVFVAFAKFCVESPVVIASIALSFIGYAIVKARDSARGV